MGILDFMLYMGIPATLCLIAGFALVIYEEFKGTGNLEIHLDRHLQQRRIFPAMDLLRSGTRREEALMPSEALQTVHQMRRALAAAPDEALPSLLDLMRKTETNAELLRRMEETLRLTDLHKRRQSTH